MSDAAESRGGRGKLVPLLSGVLAAQLVFYVGLLLGTRFPIEHQGAGGDNPITRWRESRTDKNHELRKGQQAPAIGGISTGSGTTAVVMLGDRDDCGTRSLMASWSEAVHEQGGTQLVFVAQRFDTKLRLPCEGGRARPRIVLDADGSIAKRFGATWTPRSFLIGPDGRVVYVQPPATADSRAAHEALASLPDRRVALATRDPRGTSNGR